MGLKKIHHLVLWGFIKPYLRLRTWFPVLRKHLVLFHLNVLLHPFSSCNHTLVYSFFSLLSEWTNVV